MERNAHEGEEGVGGGGAVKHWRFPNPRANPAEITGTLAKGLQMEEGAAAPPPTSRHIVHLHTLAQAEGGEKKKSCFMGKNSCGDDLTAAW